MPNKLLFVWVYAVKLGMVYIHVQFFCLDFHEILALPNVFLLGVVSTIAMVLYYKFARNRKGNYDK